ncbi:MAG: hypothetical protein ACRD4S_09430 [Candidatus Acidiferrales bacterium]
MADSSNPASAPSSLALSVGKGTFFGIVANFAQVGTRFVTVPIVIAYLGLGGYGIWNIIMATAAYMRFGSAGIKSAYQKYVAEATGNGDYETASKLLSTGSAVMLLLSAAGLIPISIFSHQLAHAAGVPGVFLHSAAGAISMLALFMVFANTGCVYESIIMGGHRIDLIRKVGTVTTVAEAIAIIIVLHFGYGLFAMATVMAASEALYIAFCFFVSRRLIPQIRVNAAHVTKTVLYELARFGGSYQLVSVLEILYVAILPVAILRSFGDSMAGVYAIVTRVITAALILDEAFLLPILSGGTMVFASGSVERMRSLLIKSFKITVVLSLPPLAFAAAFGTLMVTAWTGQTDPSIRGALWLVALAALFKAFYRLQLVMYRASGRAVMDNIRQGLGIVTLLVVSFLAPQLGFYGVLGGLALSELAGMLFMFYAVEQTFRRFETRSLLPDVLKVAIATMAILAAGSIALHIPLPRFSLAGERITAAIRLGIVTIASLAVTWPAVTLTKSLTAEEGQTLLHIVFPSRRKIINTPSEEAGG